MQIINKCSQKIPLNLENETNGLLRFVPDEDLIGLDSITLIDKFPQKWHKNISGKYFKKHKSKPARIEIAFGEFFNYKPHVFGLTPFMGKFSFALTFYLEIGHHNGQMTLKESKKEIKIFAKKYRKKRIKLAFPFFLKFMRPFMPLINWHFRKYPD